MDKPLWVWASFFGIVALLLIFDLGLLHRKEREISIRESLWLTAGYIFVSLCFGWAVWYYLGAHNGNDFFTGYIIEKSLSMDNIFVISMVFNHFYVPRRYQHRVLFWGVLGAVLLRGLMIGLGAAIIQKFGFILYLFGAFLIFTGVRMLFFTNKNEKSLEENKLFSWLKRHIPITPSLHGNKFFVYEASQSGKLIRIATPLFLVLIFIELADIIFAVDSVPAVFAITTDPFIVYTSNIFAVLGLRALYFTIAAMLYRFVYIKHALALVLVFIGSKIFLVPFIGKLSSGISLSVTLALLAGGIILSLMKTKESK